jgi:hypothetical protein
MESINTILERIKNTKGSQIGPIINKIKRNNEWLKEIENKTSFLNSSYEKISLPQRIYHIVFSILKIEKCTCGKPKEFTKYDRFSNDRNKKDSNYYMHCGKIECLVKEFKENTGGKQAYGALIHKISGDIKYKSQLLERTDFLEPHYSDLSDSQRFYHIFFEFYQLETCPYCNGNKKFTFNSKFSEIRYDKVDANYYGTCESKKCMAKYNSQRTKKAISEKYGSDNMWDIPGYREGLEYTNLKKYGFKYFMGTPEFREKCQGTYDKNWRGEHPTKNEEVQGRKRKTNLGKYGFINALQNPEIYQKHIKSCYKSKEYELPSGKIIRLQGDEPWAMDILLEKYNEMDLITDKKEMSDILGSFKFIINSKESIYFPDIYIKSKNTIIEVKSEYTYNFSLEENKLKKDSVKSKGILFQFWIFTREKKLSIIT